jgi:hypothetical protein
MDMRKKMRLIVISMSPSEHYLIGRMLMVRERLTDKQWKGCEHLADVLCSHVLRQLPIDHPESAIWDNRRPRR